MAIIRLYQNRGQENPEAKKLLARLRADNYAAHAVHIEYVLRVEFDDEAPIDAVAKMQLLFDPVGTVSSTDTGFDHDVGPIREICYKRGWTDPEKPSAMHAFEVLQLPQVRWVRVSKRFQFEGLSEAQANDVVKSHLDMNEQVQILLEAEWDTLVPQGRPGGVEEFDIRTYSLDELEALLIKTRRMHVPRFQFEGLREVFRKLARLARDGELEMIAAAWSDHCKHTTYEALRLLRMIKEATSRINHPLVVSAFVDNAGGMRFYGGQVLCFKGETHISPVFGADPYGGEGTKHGGVQRDIIEFALGAYPIAGTTAVATVDPHILRSAVPIGAFHPQTVVRETIRATADYCNPMGIPMAYARYLKHPRNWKGFSLGHCVGIIPEDKSQKGQPQPGDYVVVIGGPRGLDGIHGATASSGNMTHETSVLDATHVQIGAPIEQCTFKEAVPVLRDHGCNVATTDCGAAGLSSAIGEMGSETGVWVNLAYVSLKSAGMDRWQIWLSESQESGVIAVSTEKLSEAEEILRRYNVNYQVVGRFTSNHRCVVVYDPALDPRSVFSVGDTTPTTEVVVDLPYTVLTADCPLPKIEVKERGHKPEPFQLPHPEGQADWIDLCKKVLGHYNICDQSWLGHRFDQTVQGRTVIPYMGGKDERMPDDLYVSTPVRDKKWAMGLSVSTNQYYGEVDPAGQGQLMYVQAVTKLVAAGFSATEMVSCVNVYTPSVLDSPGNAWALVELVRGYVHASEKLGVPVITGKDSSSGTFITKEGERIDAPLTICVSTLGRHRDATKLVRKPFRKAGDKIVLFHPGLTELNLGGSIAFDLFGHRGDRLPQLNLSDLLKGAKAYHTLAKKGGIHSRSVVAEGGLLRNLFESAIGSGLGCVVDLETDPLKWLFGEINGCIIFTTDTLGWKALGQEAWLLGEVVDVPYIHVQGPNCEFTASVSELSELWSQTFNEVVA